MSALTVEALTVARGQRTIAAVERLALEPGRFTVLVGPNGAGKSTLVGALAGLLPAAGRIRVGEADLGGLSPAARARRIAYLPQQGDFVWPMPVADIVALGRLPHGDPFARPSAADRDAVAEAMRRTETETLGDRPVTELSGGEKARVALARVLATRAEILLLDEPAVSLDPAHQLDLVGLLRAEARAGALVLAVLHDLTLAARFADRILVMRAGRIVADGPPAAALAPAILADVFGIEARLIDDGGNAVPVAWSRRA